jgi:hypothetical protein
MKLNYVTQFTNTTKMGKKHNCGQILMSACVPFSGSQLTFLTSEELEDFPCNANMDDVIESIDTTLKKLVDGNNFTALDIDCLDFDPATVTAKDLHQLEITEICLLKGQVDALSEQLNLLNIGNEVITIDLECMTPDAAPCAVGVNQYSLLTILQLFRDKLCDFETRISNLES